MKRTGSVTVNVTVPLEVKWETDDKGENPLPVAAFGKSPVAFLQGAKWAMPTALLSDQTLVSVQEAISEAAKTA